METQSNLANSLMDGDEWQAMSEEHQATQLAAESKLAAKCEFAYQVASATCKERWANEPNK